VNFKLYEILIKVFLANNDEKWTRDDTENRTDAAEMQTSDS
jgi:hypothetical protein